MCDIAAILFINALTAESYNQDGGVAAACQVDQAALLELLNNLPGKVCRAVQATIFHVLAAILHNLASDYSGCVVQFTFEA